ncbi:MAG TPA: ATP-binding protein, partial [Rhabdochlamydiaceae bacterium]
PSYRDILSDTPLTDPDIILQRTSLVDSIATMLMQSDLMLTGIDGIGKSTTAALVYRFIEAQYQQGASRFAAPPLWLNINESTTFADIMGTIYQAIGKTLPDLKSLSSANQAHALYTLLNTAPSRLIVLDQFEYLMKWDTDAISSDYPGINDWLGHESPRILGTGVR